MSYTGVGHSGQGGTFTIFKDALDANKIKARRNSTGEIVATQASDTGALLNSVHSLLSNGDVIEFETNSYSGTTNYTNTDRQRIHYIGNGSQISGFKFVFSGTDWLTVRGWCTFRDFYFNGTGAASTTGVSISDSFAPTFEHCLFGYMDTAVEIGCATNFAELVKFSNCHFFDIRKGIVFKTPTGTGTGSYINSVLDHVTFNSATANQTGNYTYIEVQDNAIVNEGKWTNMRLWFADTGHTGVGVDLSGDATRCQFVKPVFENFGGVTGTIGIRYNSGADAGFHFVGRPIFIGSGTWTAKFSNASTKWTLGSVSAYRESGSVTVGTSGAYSSTTTNNNVADFAGLPTIYHTIGGTMLPNEIITVECKITTIAADGTNSYTIEKAYTRTGTYLLSIADYISLTTNNHFYIMQDMQTRAKTSLGSTSATVTTGAISASPSETTLDGKTIINATIEGYERKLEGGKYIGRYLGGGQIGEGLWGGSAAGGRITNDSIGTGNTNQGGLDNDGPHRASVTAATTNNMVSIRSSTNTATRRNYNPTLTVRFKLVSNTNMRAFIGWSSSTSAVSSVSDPLNALHGVGLWLDTAVSANWKIKHNAGTGASTEVTTGVAADTTVHTLKIIVDESTPKFTLYVDNGSYIGSTTITTPIPAATTAIQWYSWIETLTTAAKTYNVYYAEQESNLST
jgi:hypothetical protein